MIKAVFFDLYGTLAGFSPSRYELQSFAGRDFGIEVTPEGVLAGYALADAHMADQNSVKPIRALDATEREGFFAEYERKILQGSGVEVDAQRALEIWRRIRSMPYEMARFDDVAAAMDILRLQGLTLGLISNMNQRGNELTESLGLDPYLDFAVTSLDVGAEKPHPPIFRAALARAGVRPDEAVHVGDQVASDVEGARSVGIHPVLLDRDGTRPEFDGCPRIEGLMELPELLASL
jgi:putative hydrolase of the HAD superfamily